MQGDGSRVARLKKAFRDFLNGTRSVAATRDAEVFLEALRSQPSSSVCLELVLGSSSGLAAVHKSVRASSNLSFICSQVLPFVRFLSQPEAKAICEGTLLVQIINAIVSPPTAWNAILGHYVAGGFGEEEVETFAWLCSEIVMQPTAEFASIAAGIELTLQSHSFTSHTSSKVRELGYRIQKIFQMRASSGTTSTEDLEGPGGRHDNDFADFRKISIYPTRDELSSTIRPFYRRADEVAKSDPAERAGKHLDNQFRLLREDMLAELREDLQNAMGQKKTRRRVHVLGELVPVGIDTGDERRGRLCNLRVRVGYGLEQLANFTAGQRKLFLKDNPGLLRHQSFGAIRCDDDIIGFALVVRNTDDLVRDPPVFGLQFCSPDVMTKVINMLPTAQSLEFLALDTPMFAYEPVLSRLKKLVELPLETQLLHCCKSVVDEHYAPAKLFENLVQKVRALSTGVKVLRLGDDKFSLDEAQADALASIMERSLAIIQGPPGTGKSYVGAIAAKLLLHIPGARILVLSYTNHALDQFLEDLLKIGIEQDSMTRLGSKYSTATACLSFETQSREAASRLTKAQHTLFFRLRQELNRLRTCIKEQFENDFNPSSRELLNYLEFSEDVQLQLFWRAFQIPDVEDGFQMAAANGSVMDESRRSLIREKRIIGCTTTAAAKYSSLVEAAQPDFVLVEEAGEILEAHILAALSPSTKGLILIGDHKQLRPKCKNYSLSVEKGSGFDLNRSMVERLVLQGHHHSTLLRQHRMHPDISLLVRSMTYPDLLDGEKTLSRPAIRGMRDRVAFVNHSHPEGDIGDRGDRFDTDQKTSKQNRFEAEMILKTVKYLGQQGYKTENMVVLTPYLGQLRLLQEMLSRENDPLLNDLDSHELIRAGLLTVAAGKTTRSRLRLSTIDNYQGEESDIVIASLTRSNNRGDIGFMKSPERLNVLLSRARDAIIMFGNMETFLASSQGELCWVPFFKLMRKHDYLQDGLHVYCEQHPERSAVLYVPEDFDLKCPDGGCSEICGVALGCEKKCEKQHSYQGKCGESHARCRHCLQEEADIARRAKRDLEIEKDRQAKQAAYRQELLIIQDEIESLKRQNKYLQEEESQSRTMQQLRDDLAALKETRERQESMEKSRLALTHQNEKSVAPIQATSDIAPDSARYEWERMKRDEHASNAELDTLMSMIGLESVKMSFLDIKSTVDTALRQGVSTENERFGCSLLGNPGTGKYIHTARIVAPANRLI
ncbi:cbbX [Beauveria brongniartii RCEF 3172]|uniref:CbbX n=1 Tax=Beauveria brongniartii RCEF 3172 TaxID=1081107 RepID=A0A167IGW0_9HYPO|nr:cbbX [Beauveria brongniartii RCEF 3172]